MSERNDGGPAFPVSTRPEERDAGYGHQDGNTTWQYGGMTLRDYFAAKALASFIANTEYVRAATESGGVSATLAKIAYEMADEMLKARAR